MSARAALPVTPARHRVVVTGVGVVSCLGGNQQQLLAALHDGRSGLQPIEGYARLGLRARLGGPIDAATLSAPGRKLGRFFAAPAHYAWQAAHEAIAQAALQPAQLSSEHCGLILGGGAALSEHEQALADHRLRGVGRLSPFLVPRGMSSAPSAALAHAFDIGGPSYTVSAACSSAAQAIGQAMEAIACGRQQLMITGGTEELHDSTAMWFDAMGALSGHAGDGEGHEVLPYAATRDGFALAAGAGMLVLESLSHARARGATVLAELAGYGVSTEAASMVGPGARGIARAMRQALHGHADAPDYINTHACATAQGDLAEWQAIEQLFAERGQPVPALSSIKGQSGHAPAAAGAIDAVACVLMLQHGFLAAGRLPAQPDTAFAQAPLLRGNRRQAVHSVLSNSFGFGGSAASLLLRAAPMEGA